MPPVCKRALRFFSVGLSVAALAGCSTSIALLHSTRKYSIHDYTPAQVRACYGAPSSQSANVWTYVRTSKPAPNVRKYKPKCVVRVFWQGGKVDKVTYNGKGYLAAMAANECYGMRRACKRK